jgi:probable phosphomutase (TIGR03848 family)
MRLVSSPLPRCVETAQAIADAVSSAASSPRPESSSSEPDLAPLILEQDDRLVECRYGEWTGQQISELTKDPLWITVQLQPSAARFPGGESMPEVSARAIAAVRDVNSQLDDTAVWVACSHGDVIKAILADALGMHLDAFQRIVVDPCSVSVVRYTAERPYVLRMNDTTGDLAMFASSAKVSDTGSAEDPASSGPTIGGGTGSGAI